MKGFYEQTRLSAEKIAHLGFIQDVISRMAANSFMLKGWSITLAAALFTLTTKDSNTQYILAAFFPALLFAALDTYFFWQEKLFRRLYDAVANDEISSDNFTLKTTCINSDRPSLFSAIFSLSIIAFHGALITGIVLSVYLLAIKKIIL